MHQVRSEGQGRLFAREVAGVADYREMAGRFSVILPHLSIS